MSHFVRHLVLLILISLSGYFQVSGQKATDHPKADSTKAAQPAYLANPSAWINSCYSRLFNIYLYQSQNQLDTSEIFPRLREHRAVIILLKSYFYGHEHSLNIRTVYNMKMQVTEILADVMQIFDKIHRNNERLVEKEKEVILIKSEISEFQKKADSAFRENFSDAVKKISADQHERERVILSALRRSTVIESMIVEFSSQIYRLNSDISGLLQEKEASLSARELPPIWRSPPGVYPSGVGAVLKASFLQTLESLKYYGEWSLWRIIIFRGLIVLLCLVPIKIFQDRRRKRKILADTDLTFLGKFPKTASVIMGMALSPFIFVHPPNAFLEVILIGLTFTVTMLTLKNYPKINKPLLIFLVSAFLILFLINFFVTPTFVGRLIYCSSILLLIPLYKIYKQLPSYGLELEKTVRFLIFFLAIHLIAGWILVIMGIYTLGRSVILSAYSLLIISMILRIAIYTLLDYFTIIGYFFNKQVKMVKINTEFVHRKTKPLLFILAGVFLVMAYLSNMNIFEIVKSDIYDFMYSTRRIGNAEFQFISIFLFFLSVYISFALASLIRHTFEPQHDETVKKRSRLGSFLMLFRLLILISGFIIAILASGLSLSDFSIFLGALGVGIGFGLQNIVSNLISGLIIAFERPFVVGDVLDLGNETCKVKDLNLRATRVSTSDGADILIPNNTFITNNLKNWTISGKQRFIELRVITTHEAIPEEVMKTIEGCIGNQHKFDIGKSEVLFAEINDTGFVFKINLLIGDLANGSMIKSDLLTMIHSEFVKRNIRFPHKNYSSGG